MLKQSIDSDCREIIQGNTYSFSTEPYMTTNFIAVELSGDNSRIYEKSVIQQWRGTVHFSKQYEYVGLTQSAAEAGAASVTDAYTQQVAQWGIGIEILSSNNAYFQMMQVGSGPQCFAEATPTHVAGDMWKLQVHVNATIDMYTAKDASAPTASTLKSLVSNIANFPNGV